MISHYIVAESAASAGKRKRCSHPKKRIKETVQLARHVGAVAAAAQMNKKLSANEKLHDGTVDSWLSRFRKEGAFWEKAAKRGRPAILDSAPGLRDEWSRQVDALRAQGQSVTGRVAAVVAQGVMEEKTPSLLDTMAGLLK